MSRSTVFLIGLICLTSAAADEAPRDDSAPARGYRFLTEKPYLTPDFDQDIIDNVWKAWPEPLRSQAEKASADQRRKLIFSRYGLTPRPDDPTKPLQYVVGADGKWTMNCFACHGGQIEGTTVPGLPNSRFALATLTEETRVVKSELGRPFSRMDVGSLFVPLGATNGTTNAVNFGVALMAFRDKDLNVHTPKVPPTMVHHDMDAPPWWHFKKRSQIYIDGFTEKSVRGLMQFMLIRENGPEKFRAWEADFKDVYAYLESLTPPKYPHAIDRDLAARGKVAFERVCAECHGTYGEKETYPARVVPIAEIGTDPVRYKALLPKQRQALGDSWFADHGGKKTIAEPAGYLAPPLDGVWASAPYFHNGSVPTLRQVLFPEERPKVWKRTETGYDRERVGLDVETFERLPEGVTASWEKRTYFDTTLFGKSAAGHDYPSALTDEERRAVLEYLKTL